MNPLQDSFKIYLQALQNALAAGDATEHTHRPALKSLIEALEPGVTATNEPKQVTDCGKPDMAVRRGAVPREAWAFQVGGYQVLHKWLKDRKGRNLAFADLHHYQKVVVALAETIRLMAEIDTAIEAHGGWPDALADGA